jgi:hypothetical protein
MSSIYGNWIANFIERKTYVGTTYHIRKEGGGGGVNPGPKKEV